MPEPLNPQGAAPAPQPSSEAAEPRDIFAEVESAPAQAQPGIAPAAPAPGRPAKPAPMPKGSPSGGKKAVVIILMILFIAIVGVVGYYIYQKYIAVQSEPVSADTEITIPAAPTPAPTAPGRPMVATAEEVLPLPTVPESTPDTIAVEEVDTDGDRLTDKEESRLGTDPTKIDTDNDKLGDYEEVNIYKTDPLDPDSDDDGFEDGEEVSNGYDPTDPAKGARLPGSPFPEDIIE